MRKLILLQFALLCAFGNAEAQNLLPNPSFELYGLCPIATNKLNNSNITWYKYTNATPDYFNTCALPTSGAGVPANLLGNEPAASGNAYIGVLTHTIANHIEYVAANIPALKPGARYKATMKVSLADKSNIAGNDLGMFFFKSGPSFINTTGALNVTPQASFNNYGFITGKNGWTTLTTTFKADSAYTTVVLGAFHNPLSLNVTPVPPGTLSSAYYFIDDVSLKMDMRVQFQFSDSLFCANDSIRVNYTVDSSGYFSTANQFQLQLSDASGNFANPVIVASLPNTTSGTIRGILPDTLSGGNGYRIRIVALNPADTSLDNGKDITIKPLPAKPVTGSNAPVCSSDTLFLNASSATTGVSWSWKGPLAFSSKLPNTMRSNLASAHSGRYIVTASLAGCSVADSIQVIVKQAPSAITATANTPLCEGDSLGLSVVTSTINGAYAWTGPASFTGTVNNMSIPKASLTANGTYAVTVTLNGCSRSDSVKVLVKPMPYVTTAGNIDLCIGKQIALKAKSVLSNVNYTWNGPNGYTSQIQNPTILNANLTHTGAYIVTAKLNGCIDIDTIYATVYPMPAAPAASSNSPVCLTDTLKISSVLSQSATYTWKGPNNFTSGSANIIKNNTNFADSGMYRLTVTNAGGCIRKDSIRVSVKPSPVVTASNTSPACEGGTFILNTTGTYQGTQFLWTGPNSFTSTARNTTVTNAASTASGTYMIRASYNGCTYSTSTNVTIKPLPVAKASSNMPICNGEILMLNANVIPGATYSWKGPNGFNSNHANPTIGVGSATLNGHYILTITKNNCTSKPDTTTIKVNTIPVIGAYASPGDTLCAGTEPTFVAFVQFAAVGSSFQWYKNYNVMRGVTSLTHLMHDPTDGDILYCKMTATGVCSYPLDINSDTIRITVLPIITQPVVKISANPGSNIYPGQQVVFTANVQHGGTTPKYQWYKNGSEMSGARYATWTTKDVNPGDRVSVQIISEDPCTNRKTAADTLVLLHPTHIGSNVSGSELSLFPNPNRGSFSVRGIHGHKVTADVVNSIGQVVHHIQASDISGDLNITATLATGVYMLRISADDTEHVMKFIVAE